MENILFSIIIPTLNEENYLALILKDLLKQKDQNFEVIIVDAQSHDRTKEIALSSPIKNLQFFEEEKQNVSFQRNFGAKKAKGSYLLFLDADSRVNMFFTSKLKNFIQKNSGLIFLPSLNPTRDQNSKQMKLFFRIANFFFEMSQNLEKPFSSGGSMIWEKNFFNFIGGFEEQIYIAEDHSIIQKARKWGVKAKFMKSIRVGFSLRRMKKDGQLRFFYKNLVATAHIMLKGDIYKKIFEYEMGGGHYKKIPRRHVITDYLKQIKKFFRTNVFESIFEN
jgi:glycosyltransferase involved in cell wall biosynthesis